MKAKNDNITKDPAAAGRKSKRGKGKLTLLKESLALTHKSDVETFQAGLLILGKEFLTNKSIQIRMFAWKELMKYSFPQKSSLQGELNHHHNVKAKIYVVPAFSDDNVDNSEHHMSK